MGHDLKLNVPTYGGKWLEEQDPVVPKFGEPHVPVLVRPAEGLRVILGSHEWEALDKPDIQIERRHNGWMIFLHPLGGCDASGFVIFLDDGRSFVAQETGLGPADAIEMRSYDDAIAELDDIKPTAPSRLSSMPAVVSAFQSAKEALAGESNDDEHDALLALVESLEKCGMPEHAAYEPEEVVRDFVAWTIRQGECPNQDAIDLYVKTGRPANSCPVDVKFALVEWFEKAARQKLKREPREEP